MLSEKPQPITDANLYAGFNHISRALIKFYRSPNLPVGNYDEQAMTVVNFHLQELRREAQFTQPDYDLIRHK